ncbi:MAG: hypothetical protein COB98_05490 [Flavobacteriaceae bacterium]|nr:MAG: hypothetical protein COB98_05490 [Flavobacteriaceae bacterium]
MKKLMMLIVIGVMVQSLQAETASHNKSYFKIYEWEVIGKGIKITGTTHSLEQAKYFLKMASQGEIVISSTIKSYAISSEELKQNKTLYKYTWSVAGKGFNASGSTFTLQESRQLIKRISGTSIQEFKLIKKQ